MAASIFPKSIEEWAARMEGATPPTSDDQSRTWGGRVLDTKEAVLEFLAEAQGAGVNEQRLASHDRQP